jgi:hypothetical protein
VSEPDFIPERAARDDLAEILGFGVCLPIQNLPPFVEQLSVPYEERAMIRLGYSQPGVTYRLAAGDCDEATGNTWAGTGAALQLRTAQITEDTTFTICARKAGGRTVALNRSVRVRVGLDIQLPARVLVGKGTKIFDPTFDSYPDEAARICPHGSAVRVEITGAQEGVDYSLESEPASDEKPGNPLSVRALRGRGPGESIILTRAPLAEDLVLRIRASRNLEVTATQLLAIRLPVKVQADPGLAIELVEGPIAAYGTRPRLRIASSQASASYQVHARAIPDIDYRPSGLPAKRVATIAEPGEPRIRVALPEPFRDWRTPAGFAPVGDPVQGTGRDMNIPLPAADTDQVLLVRAVKSHERPGDTPIPSQIRLAAAAVLLVRPSPKAELDLALDLADGTLAVDKGEPGVFYWLRPQAADGGEFPRPAYIHKRDPGDPRFNKGIGALTIGVDLVLARSREDVADPETSPPLTPRVQTKGITSGGELWLRAVKAQTGLAQAMAASALIPATATISVDSAEVQAGQSARFLVAASDPADRYELLLDGVPVRRARNGNGEDLVFVTDGIERDSAFVLEVRRRDGKGIPLGRRMSFLIRVRS